jgi:hypothetical protein
MPRTLAMRVTSQIATRFRLTSGSFLSSYFTIHDDHPVTIQWSECFGSYPLFHYLGLFLWGEPARVPELAWFRRDPAFVIISWLLNFILRLYGNRAGPSNVKISCKHGIKLVLAKRVSSGTRAGSPSYKQLEKLMDGISTKEWYHASWLNRKLL